jgi:hypothetical protein
VKYESFIQAERGLSDIIGLMYSGKILRFPLHFSDIGIFIRSIKLNLKAPGY